jgi:hypothetical protein
MDKVVTPKISRNRLQDQKGLLSVETPVVFANGTSLYKRLAREYIVHKKGFFYIGPFGRGEKSFL